MTKSHAYGFRGPHQVMPPAVALSYSARIDAKFHAPEALAYENRALESDPILLDSFLPMPFVKGTQASYLDNQLEDAVPVVNTGAIQGMAIDWSIVRYIAREDFDVLPELKKVKRGDVLVTVDGGVSIGKPVLFEEDFEAAVDSHIAVLRPKGITPMVLAYLLASPAAQSQFRRYESGASGQTTVTEDDMRRFVFSQAYIDDLKVQAPQIQVKRLEIAAKRSELDAEEAALWNTIGAVHTAEQDLTHRELVG